MQSLSWYDSAIVAAKVKGLHLRVTELEQQRAKFIASQRNSRH